MSDRNDQEPVSDKKSDLSEAELQRLSKETRAVFYKIIGAYNLTSADIAQAVDLYYDCQRLRLMHANKKRTEAPTDLINWFNEWLELGEVVIKRKLEQWVRSPETPPETLWAIDQIGIGPVMAAGLAAHIDVTKANTPSAVWKFAGLAPGSDRKVKGEKLPYNARLKTLCWKAGESFVKVSGKPTATYGRLYSEFKAEEVRRNDAGLYKEAAHRELASKKITDKYTKEVLATGKLIDAHLHSRAKRRAVKIFLSHYWVVGREARGLPVRKPYSETVLGHDGIIEAIPGEQPHSKERASDDEQSINEKRARKKEPPKNEERAPNKEKPHIQERALGVEQPEKEKRAPNPEQPKMGERATGKKKSTDMERARQLEQPKKEERAREKEPPLA